MIKIPLSKNFRVSSTKKGLGVTPGTAAGGRKPPGRAARIVSWTLYDWANSAFTTIVVTFVYSRYFVAKIAADENTGTTQWSLAFGLSAVAIALLSPVVGAIADRGGLRKRLLGTTMLLCLAATAGLFFVGRGQNS